MLIGTVDNFLARHGMSPTQFGRDAAHDPRLVSDLRAGRVARPPLDQRLRGFMDGFERAQDLAARQAARTDASSIHSRETPDAR